MKPIDNGRNLSIDMFRGLVMLLMVTVNEFWAVIDIPHFLEHFAPFEDGMGVSDIVYPMFLFAMGMSVPLALEKRYAKGLSVESTLGHILSRTAALLVMGLFIVNAEGGSASTVGLTPVFYWLLMVVGFFLLWNRYPDGFKPRKWLQGAGAAILLFLAFTFRSPEGGYFQASWWGILGQIGWMYLFTAVSYLLLRRCHRGWFVVLWGLVLLLNVFTAPLREGGSVIDGANLVRDLGNALHIGNGHGALMALGGAILTMASREAASWPHWKKIACGLAVSGLLLAAGLFAHRFWITSKNLGTLPWCLYVTALSVALYTLLRVLEHKGLTHWFAAIRPAGTATLTVYTIPYLFYFRWLLLAPVMQSWFVRWQGVFLCLAFSFLCIWTAALLGRLGLKLKI